MQSIVTLVACLIATANAARVVVFGGSGNIGGAVCKALVAKGHSVLSVSRSGTASLGPANLVGSQKSLRERYEGESWLTQVEWIEADAGVAGAALKALEGGQVEGVVSCIGSGTLLTPSSSSWIGNKWSEAQLKLYAKNYDPNVQAIAAAKAVGARRFVFLGVSSEADLGFAGTQPGLYTGKADVTTAARETFGNDFIYVGPHAVVENDADFGAKALDSVFGRGLVAVNKAIGKVATMGEDFATTTSLTPPVALDDLGLVVAAVATGSLNVPVSERYSGMTIPSGMQWSEGGVEQVEQRFKMRHVDGTAAIKALAREASRGEVGGAA